MEDSPLRCAGSVQGPALGSPPPRKPGSGYMPVSYLSAVAGYFLSTHTWIHSYLHRADSNQDSKMSFKEIKSLLRMLNVDMNDMYAYRLFKVGSASSATSNLCSRGGPPSESSAFLSTQLLWTEGGPLPAERPQLGPLTL